MSNKLSKGIISPKVKEDSDRCWIEGVLTDSEKIDREDEVVDQSAFPDVIESIKNKNAEGRPLPIVIEHRRSWPMPVGSVTKAWQDGSKLRFRGFVGNSFIGKEVQSLIRDGILHGCSIGGDPIRKHVSFDPKTNKPISHLTKVSLDELSVTACPVQPAAIMSLAKSLNTSTVKIKKALNKLDAAIAFMKISKAIEDVKENHSEEVDKDKPAKLQPEEIDRLKQSLEDIALLMGINLKKEGEEAGEGGGEEEPMEPAGEGKEEQPDIPAPPEYKEDKDLDGRKAKPDSTHRAEEDGSGDPVDQSKPHGSGKSRRSERYCPDCDLTLDADRAEYDVSFCPKCGREFVERYASNMNKHTCERCSYEAEFDEDAEADGRLNFCPRCGDKFDKEEEKTDMAKVKKSKKDKMDEKEEEKAKKGREAEEDADVDADVDEAEEEKEGKKAAKPVKAKKEEGEEDADLEADEDDEEDADVDDEEEEGEEGDNKDADADADEDEDDEDADADEDDDEDDEDADADEDDDEDDEDADADEDDDEDDEDADADEDDDEDDEDADAGEGEEEEKEEEKPAGEEKVGAWAEPDLDDMGRPMYRCADCDAHYDINDKHVKAEKCVKCVGNESRLMKSFKGVRKAILAMKSVGMTNKQIAKALGSIAVAPSPKGADTHEEGTETYDQKKDASHAGPKGDDIAIAPNPKGASTHYTTKSKKIAKLLKNMGIEYPQAAKDRPGADMEDFDNNFRHGSRANKGGAQEGTDQDKWVGTKPGDNGVKGEHSSLRPFGKEFVQAAGDHKLTVPLNYGVQKSIRKLAKSLDPLIHKINRMEKVLNSSTKKSKIAGVEKSQAGTTEVKAATDRDFAARLLGRTK